MTMLFKICEVGDVVSDGLSAALTTLNTFQTIWKLVGSSRIAKPSTFDPSANLSAVPIAADKHEFSIGVSTGRVDAGNRVSLMDLPSRRALVSEYEWTKHKAYEQSELFWEFAMLKTCFQADMEANCADPYCIGFADTTVDNFLVKVLQLHICPTCEDGLLHRHRYQVPEIREIIDLIKYRGQRSNILTVADIRLPILERQIRRQLEKGKVLEQYGIIIVMHFLEDLLPFIEGLISMGAQRESIILLVKPYPYGPRKRVHSYLVTNHSEIRIEYLEELPPSDDLIRELVEVSRSRSRSGKILVIEDGGYIVPFLHKNYQSDTNPCIGAVEQTTRGLRKDEKLAHFLFPILNVAKSRFKDEYEAPLVGQAIVNNIQRLRTQETFFGNQVLVVGFGAIGRAVADAFSRGLGAVVKIYDNRPDRVAAARVRGYEASKLPSAFAREAKIVIGTTGTTSIDKEILESISNGTTLVSASSDRVEIDGSYLRIMAEKQTFREGLGTYYERRAGEGVDRYLLLGDGYPINFFSGFGIPNRAIDPILAQLFIGAVHLAIEHATFVQGINDVMDDLIERDHLLEDFLAEHVR